MKKPKLYAISENPYKDFNRCGCCKDASTYGRLKCFIKTTFTEKPKQDELYKAVREFGTGHELTFEAIKAHVEWNNFEKTREEDETYYYMTFLTDKQAKYIWFKTHLYLISIDEIARKIFDEMA